MFNNLIGKVSGVDGWMILSLVIFGTFFIGVIMSLFLMKKPQVELLKNIPFNEQDKQIMS
jgi:hypothetical protein